MAFNALTWVIQPDISDEQEFEVLSNSISALGCRLEHVEVIPFSHEAVSTPPTIDGPCLVYGSSGLLNLAKRIGWRPAGWDGPSFEADHANAKLGALALNADAISTVYSDIPKIARAQNWETVFVRPNAETKEFAGQVYSLDDLDIWVERLEKAGYLKTNDNRAIVAQSKTIGREWRAFVAGDKIASICQYAEAGELCMEVGAPDAVTDFVAEALQVYRPAPCFVIDVTEVLNAPGPAFRVVEYNSINSAGFYRCDIGVIVEKLSAYGLSNFG